MADDRNTWADPKIVDDDRIDHTDLALRAAAEFVHRNESLHRHDHEGPVCVYCALVASNALRAAGHVKFTPVPGWKWTEHPENQAIYDRIPVVLVDWKLGRFGVVEDKVLARRPTPFGRVGLTGDEIAVLTGGDLNSSGKPTGWDLGQRCYRRLRQMVDDGLVGRTPPGGSPVFYWPTQKLIDQQAASLAELPPLTTIQESP